MLLDWAGHDVASRQSAADKMKVPRPLPSPAPTFLSTTLPSTLGYFPEGMPLAYLIATVVTGLGLLIVLAVYMSRPEQVATHSVPPAAERQLPPSRCRIGGPDHRHGRLQVERRFSCFLGAEV